MMTFQVNQPWAENKSGEAGNISVISSRVDL